MIIAECCDWPPGAAMLDHDFPRYGPRRPHPMIRLDQCEREIDPEVIPADVQIGPSATKMRIQTRPQFVAWRDRRRRERM